MSDEKPEEKAETGKLVTPEHGRGKIWQGAPANPVAGPGRPPSEIRKKLRGSFDERVKVLEEIADSDESKPTDRIRAIDLLAKYGLGTITEVSTEDVRDRLSKTIRVIQEHLEPEQAADLLGEISPIWR